MQGEPKEEDIPAGTRSCGYSEKGHQGREVECGDVQEMRVADESPGGAGPHLPGPQQPAHPPTQVRGPAPKVGSKHKLDPEQTQCHPGDSSAASKRRSCKTHS